MKQIILQELSSPGCHNCRSFEEFWNTIKQDFPNVQYESIGLTTDKGQEIASKYMIFAAPGIIINGDLFSSGGFDKNKFVETIKKLS